MMVAVIRGTKERAFHCGCRPDDRPRMSLTLVVVIVSLATFIPFGVEAWAGRRFAWDWAVSHALHASDGRRTVLNSHVDVLALVLHPAVQALGGAFVAVIV